MTKDTRVAYTLIDLANEVLQKAELPMSAEEVWNKACEMGLTNRFKSQNPKKTLGITLARNLEDKDTPFEIVAYRPKRFWLKERKGELQTDVMREKIRKHEEIEEKEELDEEKYSVKEKSLHPLLVKFVDKCFRGKCKTIPHEESRRMQSGKNKWIHPDIVGLHFPEYSQESLELLKHLGKLPCLLFSFELKVKLTLSNIKQYYFQAVSNSSWANEGYLVFLHWNEEEELREELERLNQAFGIGVIKLDAKKPECSKVVFSAKRKDELDTKTIDLLVKQNEKFRIFIKNISYKLNFANSIYDNENFGDYDRVYGDEEIEEHIKKHNII